MAMRARGGGAAAPNRGRPGGVRPVFEDFKPTAEWRKDDESHILVIHLPGFMKEQIKVSTEGRNTIRVRGERLIAGNRWSRFQEDFQVPENGEMNSIRARFQGGTLYITVPRKIQDKHQEPLPPKTPTTSVETQKQPTPSQKDQEKDLPPAKTSQTTEHDKRLEPEKALTDPLKNVTPSNKGDENEKGKNSLSEKADDNTEKMVEKELGKGSEGSKELREEKKTEDQVKGKETNNENLNSKTDHDHHGAVSTIGKKTKRAVKGIVELNEERQLLVNVGVAVLVIVALSAYVTYKFTSGKDQS